MLTVVAVRAGKGVTLRFRGVKDSNTSEAPTAGVMQLRSVKGGSGGCLSLGLFGRNNPGIGYARVRIDVGDARLEIVCQDAEWWEDEASPEQ
jgi:hypothetical protein